MTADEAAGLIRGAVPEGEDAPASPVWADMGAGSGTFTFALAGILGPGGRVVAVDRETAALESLRRGLERQAADARARGPGGPRPSEGEGVTPGGTPATIVPARGDFRDPAGIDALDGVALDGVLFANALHFDADAAGTLRRMAKRLAPGGRLVVVEYQDRPPNPWVPHALPLARLEEVAEAEGLTEPRVVGERPSSYGGVLYCAWLEPA